MIEIKNNNLVAMINEKGAEVTEILSAKTGKNYFWNPKPEIWGNTSPILFPVVGKSTDNKIIFDSIEYPMTNHGFARHAIFNVSKKEDNYCALSLTEKDIPNGSFPFKFIFTMEYLLENNTLKTTYKIENTDMNKIYFTVGGHPAFKMPFSDNLNDKDYYIEFPKDDVLTMHEIDENAFYTGKTSEFNLKNREIDLAEHNVSDTYVFSNFKSSHCILREKNSEKNIVVSIEGFKYIAFWKKNDGDFICIEPWMGKSDDRGFKKDFKEKKDLIVLERNEIFKIDYTVQFNY